MTQIRDRRWELRIGRLRIAGDDARAGSPPLSVRFDITKSLGREPNKGVIEVANLSPRRRQEVEGSDSEQIQLIAGYDRENLTDTIFVADSREIYTRREEATPWTVIEAEDGGRAYRRAMTTTTFFPNVSLTTVVATLADQLGLGVGNARSVAAAAELDSGGTIFEDGLALEGPAWRALDMVCRSAGLRWSVQAGVLQLRPRRRPAETRAIRLTPSTGLIGSPTRSTRDPRTGRVNVEAQALLIPGLYPGRVVVVESDTVEGSWMVQSVRYNGISTGQEWYADLNLQDYES